MNQKTSIRRRMTVLTLLSSAVGLLLAAAALIASTWVSASARFERDLATVASIVADNSTAPLLFKDRKAANETLAALRAKPEITLACVYDSGEPGAFGSYAANGLARCPPEPEDPGLHRHDATLTLISAVILKGERVGTLLLTQTLQPLQNAVRNQVAITFVILLVSFAVSMVVARRMQFGITDPIEQLATVARHVSDTHDYSLRASRGQLDEVGELIDNFNEMLKQIGAQENEIRQSRTALEKEVTEKTNANLELARALTKLRETQAQLVQSEKLASLGALVAGVAHEINTPIGVGVTAASTLQARAAQLRQLYESDALKRSDLEHFVSDAQDSSRILLTNLNRAADLIQSFKRVAVDQTSGERRSFDLKKYIDEVLLSLNPQLNRTKHTVQVDCPERINVDSYPGALAQILTNFVTNSLVHAYDPGAHGRIRIQVRTHDGTIDLTYKDDGRGMPPEDLTRIYDPFFTTKRGTGGSGLGMHIVYNLVTQILHGTINVSSSPGHGIEIHVSFPAHAKDPARG